MSIPELFPNNTRGYEYYETYNDAELIVAYYEDIWESMKTKVANEQIELLELQLSQMLSWTADEWVKTNKDKSGAIKIYELTPKLFPRNKKVVKNANKNIKIISRMKEEKH